MFEKYRYDKNNYSLYIWGYAMSMLDIYKTNEMLLLDINLEDIMKEFEARDVHAHLKPIKDFAEWTFYG